MKRSRTNSRRAAGKKKRPVWRMSLETGDVQVTAVVGISGIDYSGIAGQAQWEVHVQVRVPGARHVLADAEWLERCTIAGTAGREMAQKWLCSTGRYMDGHPEHLVTWAADFLVPIVDIVLALILDASLRLVPGEENACDWRDEEGKKSLSKNKAINSRHRYYTQLFGGAASLAAEPRHQSRYMHSLDFPNLETFHPGNLLPISIYHLDVPTGATPPPDARKNRLRLLQRAKKKVSCTHNICIDRDRQALAQSEGPVSPARTLPEVLERPERRPGGFIWSAGAPGLRGLWRGQPWTDWAT
ncbi:hypothetical protein CI102_9894 [Trichoderma harzianum]|nr:hypothetical protein CI102_9894 [Trichoderma harzianum]